MVEAKDLARLVREMTHYFEKAQEKNEEPVGEWCGRHDIDEDAVMFLSSMILEAFKSSVVEDILKGDTSVDGFIASIQASIVMSFTVGWEAHKQYGRVTSNAD